MISENFNSEGIKAHYASARSQALAFLFTTGAKALVIAEQNSNNEDAFIGANEEAELKQEMVNEERVKCVRRQLIENNAIPVYKHSANGRLRIIRLKVKHDSKQLRLSWRSHLNLKKQFLFDLTTTCLQINPTESQKSESSRGDHLSVSSQGSLSHSSDQLFLPFLQFRNASRKLDVRFCSLHEMEACLELLSISPLAVWHSISTHSLSKP
ncbi:hypothetical protein B484DRAFT_446173 [Ochromonadaceae sp. CCMP2298]|nr:hypothetical protein B484DRAFT_446173 [Ochromonadaceae sp. CCMP2298]|eukprot:CAMPEP_0173193184 /NCGR_PEP_ID=MMETSP1141-20130122/13824_1 /TAXON_ID=483371 /ORGANISM="non described non described, Strain CCMP2298" /LENGTH=210 /DNA_ID=CAMNT_0014117505 /DNA_START=87 /DNA_END=719 /DNA_ORIENTATION=-